LLLGNNLLGSWPGSLRSAVCSLEKGLLLLLLLPMPPFMLLLVLVLLVLHTLM
jgi:hypothetical protein